MSFTLTMSSVIVGRSELEHRDPATRVVHGTFRPGLGYELAQPIFSLFTPRDGEANALARYRKAREALKLQLVDSSGSPMRFNELHIRPASHDAGSEGSLVLEVETDDPAFWSASPL